MRLDAVVDLHVRVHEVLLMVNQQKKSSVKYKLNLGRVYVEALHLQLDPSRQPDR
jgi:hypothetical protein